MSSSKGPISKDPDRRLSDPDTLSPSGRASQRARQVEASDETTSDAGLQSSSDLFPTLSGGFQTRRQRNGRKDAGNDTTPNQSKGKNQGGGSQSSPSSSSDGGVLLNIDYASNDGTSNGRGYNGPASNGRGYNGPASKGRTSNNQASKGRALNDQSPNAPASNNVASKDRAPSDQASNQQASNQQASNQQASNQQASTDQASSERQMNPVSSRGFNISTSTVAPSQGQIQGFRPDPSQVIICRTLR